MKNIMKEYNVRLVAFDDEEEAWDFIEKQEYWFLLDDSHHVAPHMIERSPTPGKICYLIFSKKINILT